MRRSSEQLAAAADAEETVYLPFHELNVAIVDGQPPELGWISRTAVRKIESQCPPPVLLGLMDDRAHFALDVSGLDSSVRLSREPGWHYEDARRAAMALPAQATGIVAQARSQIDWHRRHQFCSVCARATSPAKGGYVRRCASCGAEHFPRTDPVAIMLIIDDQHCLLGQSAGRLARTRTFSALAGFIDQGESIEEAVRREVQEEAGIVVGDVVYHSSQPWPFPSSLMIGCHGQALSRDIDMDPEEMTAVEWFHRDDVTAAMSGTQPNLNLPGPIAIAHHLIRAWIDDEVRL